MFTSNLSLELNNCTDQSFGLREIFTVMYSSCLMTIGFCLHFNWGQACILLYFEHSVFTMVDRKFGWSLHGKSAVRGGGSIHCDTDCKKCCTKRDQTIICCLLHVRESFGIIFNITKHCCSLLMD